MLEDDPLRLNLAWNADEREFLDVDLDAVLGAALKAEGGALTETNRYLVHDPYGHSVLADGVAAWTGGGGARPDVTVGAGVTSLLHALSGLGRRGVVHVVGEVYPDLPHWVRRDGGRCVGVAGGLDAQCAAVRAAAPAAVLLDRPGLGGALDDLDGLGELAEAAHRGGGLVVVDESNANYEAPGFSAARLVDDVPNLVVLRGLSKAYGLGALRIGMALSSPAASTTVRELVPPMQPSSLSLHLARQVLDLGDVARGLRERITEVRARLTAAPSPLRVLTPAGTGPSPSRPTSPHLLFDDPGTPEECGRRGLQGKQQRFWSGAPGCPTTRFRLALPLRAARLQRLLDALVSPGDHPPP